MTRTAIAHSACKLRVIALIAVFAAALTGLNAAPALAWYGGWHGGWGWGWHGWWGRPSVWAYGPGYPYAPPPLVYAPPPVVYPPPAVYPPPVVVPPSFNIVVPLQFR